LASENYERAVLACNKLMAYSEQIELPKAILLINYYFQEKQYFDIMELFTYLIFGGQFDQIVYSSTEAFYPQEIGKLFQELASWENNTPFLDRLATMNNTIELKQSNNFKWLDPILNDLIFSDKKVNLVELEKQAIGKISLKKQQVHTNGKIKEQLREKLKNV
jgi:hypothetical protein